MDLPRAQEIYPGHLLSFIQRAHNAACHPALEPGLLLLAPIIHEGLFHTPPGGPQTSIPDLLRQIRPLCPALHALLFDHLFSLPMAARQPLMQVMPPHAANLSLSAVS